MPSKSQIGLGSLTENLNDLGKPFIEAGRDAWLAGLGALSLARQESGKVADQGVKIFDKLVSEGHKFERKTSKTVRKEAREATTQVAKAASKAASSLKKGPMTYHLLPRNEDWVVRSEGSDEDISLHDTSRGRPWYRKGP